MNIIESEYRQKDFIDVYREEGKTSAREYIQGRLSEQEKLNAALKLSGVTRHTTLAELSTEEKLTEILLAIARYHKQLEILELREGRRDKNDLELWPKDCTMVKFFTEDDFDKEDARPD